MAQASPKIHTSKTGHLLELLIWPRSEARSLSTKTEVDTSLEIINSNIFKKFEARSCAIGIEPAEAEVLGINSIHLLQNGQYLVMSNWTEIYVYEISIRSLTLSYVFKDIHSNKIQTIATGKNLIASGAIDSPIKVCNFSDKSVYEFSGAHNSTVLTMAFTHDDRYLAFNYNDRHLKIWDFITKNYKGDISYAHEDEIHSLLFTKDNRFLISGSDDAHIHIWNFDKLTQIRAFKFAHAGCICCLYQEKHLLFSGCSNGAIKVWDLMSMDSIHSFNSAHSSKVTGLRLINNSRFLISSSSDSTISVWDIEQKLHLYSFKYFGTEPLLNLLVTHNDRFLITATKRRIYFIDLGSSEESLSFNKEYSTMINAIKVTNNNRLIAIGNKDGCSIWDYETKEIVYQSNGKQVWSLDISPDNQMVALGCADGTIDLLHFLRPIRRATLLERHAREVSCLMFNKDGSQLISTSMDSPIYIHDTKTGKLLPRFQEACTEGETICSFDLTKSNQLVCGSRDKSITIWNLNNNKKIWQILNSHDGPVISIRLTHDDKRIISSSSDLKVKVWDMQTRKAIYVFRNYYQTEIPNLLITKDDTFIVAIYCTGAMEIFNLKTMQSAYTSHKFFGERCKSASLFKNDDMIVFSRGKQLQCIENPLRNFSVQYSFDCSSCKLLYFMPLMSYLLTKNLEHRLTLIRKYPDLVIHPQGWNWLHIASMDCSASEVVKVCFEKQVPFKMDLFGKTPLHYLLGNKGKNRKSINLVLQNFSSFLKQSQRPSFLLDSLSDIFFDILELNNSSVGKFLKGCTVEPEIAAELEYHESVATFKNLRKDKQMIFCLGDSLLYSEDVKKKMITSNPDHLIIGILPFHWDYHPTSKAMRRLVKALRKASSQEIFKTAAIYLLIEYLWKQIRIPHYIAAFLYSVRAILISVYIGSQNYTEYFGPLIFILTLLLSVFDVMELMACGCVYFTSIWNLFDLFGIALTIALAMGVEEVWLRVCLILFTYAKWLSYFRVFPQTRKFIQSAIAIIKETWNFTMFLAFIIIGYSLVFLELERDNNYPMHIFQAYRLVYFAYELSDINSWIEMIFFIITSSFVCIGLLNMLIAMMGDILQEVKLRSIMIDNKEVLGLIEEVMDIYATGMKILSKFKPLKCNESYLFYAERVVEQND